MVNVCSTRPCVMRWRRPSSKRADMVVEIENGEGSEVKKADTFVIMSQYFGKLS